MLQEQQLMEEEQEPNKYKNMVHFEPMYETIKTDRNVIWSIYEEKIYKMANWLSWYKNFDKEELVQQSFIYFCDLCEHYDPYYEGKFFHFDKYLFKNLLMKLRAYVQRYYFNSNREKPSEYCEILMQKETTNTINQVDSDLYLNDLLSNLDAKSRQILKYTLIGMKQQEIGQKVGISQSRVSVIKKQALKELFYIVEGNMSEEDKRSMRIEDLKNYFCNSKTTEK